MDLVLALEVLEHLDEPNKALSELQRVTNKYAIISVPNEPLWRILNMARGAYWSDWGNTYGHVNNWSPRAFKKLLETKFNIIQSSYPIPWQIYLCKKK